MNDNAVKWLWMQQLFGTGSRKAHEAYRRFGTPQEILSTPLSRVENDSFFSDEEKARIKSPNFKECERTIAAAENFGAKLLTPESPDYPESLYNIYSMPLLLYTVGDTSLLKDHYLISMVGTRNPDEYGLAAAKKLSGEIASLGGIVVSGLAYGIDAACHRGALEAGGKTIAFVAGGLDLDYPKKNRALRQLIEKPENGLVISEFPLGTPALPQNFPIRNRLISGVSMATVIVQCKISSGTMLTAGHAISQDRDLFAVPGSIMSANSEGCNYLLMQGAEPAVSGESILRRYESVYGYPVDQPNNQQTTLFSEMEEQQPEPKPRKAEETALPAYLNERQVKVMNALANGQLTVDDLCEQTGIAAGELLTTLTGLELFRLIEMLPGRMVKSRIK